MADVLILGIIANSDPRRLESLVASTNISRDGLKVLTAHGTRDEEEASLSLVEVAESTEHESFTGGLTRGTGVLPGFGGTGVPGLGMTASLEAFSHPRIQDYLGDATVPAGAAEGYNDAISDGRCVIVYRCTRESAPKTQAALEAAGVKDVRSYPIR